MKILVISDTHLTDKLDEKKYIFLTKIISNIDQVIINGDFWDGAMITFSQFIESPWKKLFSLLLAKNTIYIYGNHDKKSQSDARVSQFSIKQVDEYITTMNNTTFFIEHGHTHEPGLFKKFEFLPRNRTFIVLLNFLLDIIEKIMVVILGETFIQKKLLKSLNTETKANIKSLPKNYIYICGHTHSQEIDLSNRFINTGIIRHGIGQYLIIEDGIPILKNERY